VPWCCYCRADEAASSSRTAGRVEQQGGDQRESPQSCFAVDAVERGQVSRWPEVGFDDATLAIDARLLHLQAGKRLGLGSALANQLGPGLSLLVGQGSAAQRLFGPSRSPSPRRHRFARSAD
jgi:hypothetical protein